jgi:hemoglobin-like flavoprotein
VTTEPVTTLQVKLLEESFDLIASRGEELAARIYARLFELAPEVQPLFATTDLADRQRTMLATLLVLRKSLRNLEAVAPALQALGRRHAGYGVQPQHFNPAGQALLDSLIAVGGDRWKAEYTEAWAEAWVVVRDVLLSGVADADDPEAGAAVA